MIKSFFNALLRGQLRKPSGLLANKVANKMNESNGALCLETINYIEANNGDDILEIGFGNGQFIKNIFEKYPDVKVAGLDYSLPMVKQAQKRNRNYISSGQLVVKHGNSNEIPFGDNSFHKIFCVNVIYFWDKPEEHLKELHRVLKPGGTFYAVIRDKKSMDDMGFFTKGFTLYSPEDWKEILEYNNFIDNNIKQFEDQQIDFNGNLHVLKNYCISGKK